HSWLAISGHGEQRKRGAPFSVDAPRSTRTPPFPNQLIGFCPFDFSTSHTRYFTSAKLSLTNVRHSASLSLACGIAIASVQDHSLVRAELAQGCLAQRCPALAPRKRFLRSSGTCSRVGAQRS